MRKLIKTDSEKLDVLTHDWQGVEASLIGHKKDGEIFQLIINDEEVISGDKLHAIADVILQFFCEMGDIEFVEGENGQKIIWTYKEYSKCMKEIDEKYE